MLLLAFFVSLLPLASAQEIPRKTKVRAAPLYFDDDRGFENAKPPSDAVLDALLTTTQVKESAEDIEDQSRESLRSYFKAVLTDSGNARGKST
jgi:hypothetical protein